MTTRFKCRHRVDDQSQGRFIRKEDLCLRLRECGFCHGRASDPEVMRYISGGDLWSDERIREFAEKQIKCFAERQFCFWRLVHKESGVMIGFCGLQPLDDGHEIEIGWWLARDRWSQGLATEAAREALRDGFERAGLKRIVSVAMPENGASIHIMEKLGMRFERTTTRRGFAVVLYAVEKRDAEDV
jgi:RimJ/RimL family protein N-acetyltransferase